MMMMLVVASWSTVPGCSIPSCHGCGGRWDTWSSRSWLNIQQRQRFRCLPSKTIVKGTSQNGKRSVGIGALAAAPVRWNLDDVERISRGRPSKAKTGSRAVPHRLNAEERKAFELAKKRGYVVQQANSRRYPLINTYRNYCDALDLLCIRIEQGTTGLTDQVVIDFTPLHLSTADLSILRAEITNSIRSLLSLDNNQAATIEEIPKVDDEGLQTKDEADACQDDNRQERGFPDFSTENVDVTLLSDGFEGGSEPLRFQAPSRNVTKVISQTALDTWRNVSSNKARN